MAFSKVRKKSESVSLITAKRLLSDVDDEADPPGPSIRFIHLFAYPYGSMQRGQRRALKTIIAFSTEKVSEGRPSMNHARILTGSPRTR